jgi:adenylyltransferase/sulfurtransferase
MFRLSTEPLQPEQLKDGLRDDRAGACCTFEGWVRNHNEGAAVERLEYEAYAELCLSEADKILQEAIDRFGLYQADCVHRVGELAIGDMAVWVGVSSAHRGEGFDACRWIIDAIKHRLPIWKKEHYVTGDSGWVNCERCVAHTHAHGHSAGVSETEFYTRQVILDEVGPAGQERLKNAKVLVVGAGGLGCPALAYLAAAGVGTIGICEADLLEASNLHRQVLYDAADVGKPKAQLAAGRLTAQNPHVRVISHPVRLATSNAEELLRDYDLILDCTDNFDTKFLISDAAVLLGKPVVFASIYQMEGQLQVYMPGVTPCLRCLWPETPEAGCVGSCAEVGVLGAVPGVFGTLQAMEALKLLLEMTMPAQGELMLYNLRNHGQQRIRIERNEACPACGGCAGLTSIAESPSGKQVDVALDWTALEESARDGYTLVDIRDVEEAALVPLAEIPHVAEPSSGLDFAALPFGKDGRYVLCCARGMRSRTLAKHLRDLGYDVYSQPGGVPRLLASARTVRQD